MSLHPPGRTLLSVAAVSALALCLAACGGGDSDEGGEGDGTVKIWTSVDQPILDGLEKTLKPKADEAGIKVEWEKVTDINTLIMTKLNASDKPDIAVIPQPGVVANMVKRDGISPLDDVLDMDALEESMLPGTIEAGTVDDKFYGLMINANVKSLVFTPKKAWAEAGYEVPESLDDLTALTEQIKSDGGTPWCMGIASEGSNGWPATDWIEDLVMRFGGVDVYNDWVVNKVKFTDPVVVESAEYFADLMFPDGNVPGGRSAIASTDFGSAGTPMFDTPEPGCWMLKQGTFITGFFPDDVQANLDDEVAVFPFPPAEAGGENPVLGGGDLATMLSADDDTKAIMKLLADSDVGKDASATGAYISPHKDADTSLYPNEIMKSAAETAIGASAFLFDGSDQMPGEVGAGSFWEQMTSWIADQTDLQTALETIDASWPSS